MTVCTRFAPSPTGYLHIGGARTALYSWLHARQQEGRFVLRIEDTDRERSTPEAIDAILDGMAWLGLDADEGPFYQTQRMDRYQARLNHLLETGQAYYCYCSRERIDAVREAQQARKEKPRYDGRCRDLEAAPADAVDNPVVRFRTPQSGETVIEDAVRGTVTFQNAELDDLIIARSDGTPTYNFTVVVDDLEMGITDVIRGDDHLNNTARQLHILQALGGESPRYAHVPMILGEDGKRLSKRHGAVSVLQYRDEGYLPEALINYLVRLGWAYGDQEVFTRDELIEHFRIDDVNHSASTFNPSKLAWLNQQHLMRMASEEVAERLLPYLDDLGVDARAAAHLPAIVASLQERSKTLVEMAEQSVFFFRRPTEYDEKAAKKNLTASAAEALQAVRERLVALETWSEETTHAAVAETAEAGDMKMGKVAQPIRVAVSGSAVSPPIDATLALLGRDESVARIDAAIEWIRTWRGSATEG